MRILVYGAGVVGSVYGARLARSGHDVRLLARGARSEELRRHGVVLEDVATGARAVDFLPVVDELLPDDAYDVVLVAVRNAHVPAILPGLRRNAASSAFLFLVSTARQPSSWMDAVGRSRFLAGLPGVLGVRAGPVVRHVVLPQLVKPTTIGVPAGRGAPSPRGIARALRAAGFPVVTTRRIGGWQQSHAAVMTPIALALEAAGGDLERLVRAPSLLHLLVRAIEENLAVLDASGVAIRPLPLAGVSLAPARLLDLFVRRALGTSLVRAVAPRAKAAADEVHLLAGELRELAGAARILAESSERLEDAARAGRA